MGTKNKVATEMSFFTFFLIFISFATLSESTNFKNHECIRDCTWETKPKECVYDFNVEYYSVLSRNCFNCSHDQSNCYLAHCVTADGLKRAIKTVNRMLPGPSIQVCVNDTIVVNVENHLHSFEALSIHWHGIHIEPSMDGVAMINQCPILPGTSFQYRFKVEHPGTHFWHAHSAGQRADGVFGSLIVRQSEDPNSYLYDFDQTDHVIVLNDWLNDLFITKYNDDMHYTSDENPTSILINGRGGDTTNTSTRNSRFLYTHKRRDHHYRHHGRPNRENSINQDEINELPRSEIVVKNGLSYRLRFINAGIGFCPLEVSIDQHYLTIIALDGNPIQPFQVASFLILAGERLDIVLKANAEPDAYWIKVKGIGDCEINEIFQTAILRYDTSSNSQPKINITYDSAGPNIPGKVFNPINVKVNKHNRNHLIIADEPMSVLDEYTIETLTKIRQRPDKKFFFALDMNDVPNSMIYDESTYGVDEKYGFIPFISPQINNITFEMPQVPLIYQNKKSSPKDFCNEDNKELSCPEGQSEFCKCTHRIDVDLNDVVELIIVDGGSGEENHPVHFHGYSFAVLGVEKLGNSAYMPDIKAMDEMGKLKRNLVSPPLKDTVTIPSGGYTIVRFYANRPGAWVMHCHIQFHSEAGMMLVFKVGRDDQLPPIDINKWPQCGNFPDV